ncbi:hypothetical protein KKA14_16770 [bacterium]|nr:hypothetical protein [bacterium]
MNLVGIGYSIHYVDSLFIILSVGVLIGFLIQWRFYPYHYIALIPSSIFMFSLAFRKIDEFSPVCIVIAGVLVGFLLINIIVSGLKNKEDLLSCLMKPIPHYMNRMLAALIISDRIQCVRSDWLLQWGDTPQLNILSGIPSPAGNESTTPWNWGLSNDKARQALSNVVDLRPRYLVPMIDNINLEVFTRSTGLHYNHIDTVYVNNEAFRIFQLCDIGQPSKKISDEMKYDLFLECRKKEGNGRFIWNWSEDRETTAPSCGDGYNS